MTMLSGAELLIRSLEASGARVVFGVPGTQTVPIFEALRRSRLRTVLATSELSAAFMAGGWARLTGEPGVCLTIPGPGFTWALTGIAEAHLDSVPLLVISGAPPTEPPGRTFRQQELDQAAIAAPLVRRVVAIAEAGEIAARVTEALAATRTGEPGPVLLHVSARAMRWEGEAPALRTDSGAAPAPPADPSPLLARLAAARKPVLFLGQGVSRYAGDVKALAERLGCPVLTTPAGRGILPEDHPLAMGFDAIAGDLDAANALLETGDLILVLGAKLGHNGTAGFGLRLSPERLVHVDTAGNVPNANYPASLAMQADAGAVLHALLRAPHGSTWGAGDVAAWRDRVRRVPEPHVEPGVEGSPGHTAAGFFTRLREVLPRETVLVLDSGLHQLMARRYYPVRGVAGMLLPSDLQSMGYGVPTAVGARLAAPDRPVVALVGDGGFTMTGMDLLSALREGLDLVVIVFADGELGQIRMQQLRDYGAAHAVHLGQLDWSLVAGGLGVRYAEAGSDIGAAVSEALRAGGVTLIEVSVGDTARMRRTALAARSREIVRRSIGPRLIHWVKRLLRRGR